MKKFFAYFFGGIACLGVGAAFYVVAIGAVAPKAPTVLPPSAATSKQLMTALDLVGSHLPKEEVNVPADETKHSPGDSVTDARDGLNILFFGDLMLGRSVAQAIAKNGNDYPFAKIKDVVSKADYAIANLEGPLTKINNAPDNRMRFHFDPALGAEMVKAGFDAVSLANNHGLDQGAKGFADGQKNLTAAGLKYFGNATDDNGQILRFAIDHKQFAIIGAQDVYRQIDPVAIGKTIAAEKEAGNFVIVYPHWGVEYSHAATKRQTALAYAFIDAGADLIVGSHPHVVEGIEMYKGKLIFYSLGNLIFDQFFSVETQEGLGLRLKLDANGGVSVDLLPYEIPQSQPAFVDGDKKAKMLSDLASWSSPALKDQIASGSISF